MYKIELPLLAPSTNTYYRRSGHHMHISQKGRDFKAEAQRIIQEKFPESSPLTCDIELKLEIHFKHKRARDIDNYNKALLDSMTGIVYEDDSQITSMKIRKFIGSDSDRIVIKISEDSYVL